MFLIELATIIAEYSAEYYCAYNPCPVDGTDQWGNDGWLYFYDCNKHAPPGFVEANFKVKPEWWQEHQLLLHAPAALICSAISGGLCKKRKCGAR
jgi:hypothetical protein